MITKMKVDKQKINNYKTLPFWSWNDKLEKHKLISQIEQMHENCIGGFFMHARGGLQTEYLSKEWFDCINTCIEKAEELKMDAYAYDENGWPSGFVGGKLLEKKEFRAEYLTSEIGAFDKDALISYDYSGKALKRVKKGEDCLNIYLKKSFTTVDVCNPEVTDAFISLTHEQYKKYAPRVKGFFTDEPRFCGSGICYSSCLKDYFLQQYREEVIDNIGLLFMKKRGYRKYRYRYYSAMHTLFVNNYAKKIFKWCDKNGYLLTGHFFEERSLGKQVYGCGGIMPFYEYQHIPGIDYLGRYLDKSNKEFYKNNAEFVACEIAPKQLGSVASQLGKRQTLTETGGMCGWDITPKELKKLLEFQFVNGVNLWCQHLVPYAEYGQRKRDFVIHFNSDSPWVNKYFSEFNTYFEKLGKILSMSDELVSVGVLHPIQSAYFDYGIEENNNNFCTGDLDKEFQDLTETLGKNHISYHYIDENICKKYGKVNGNTFIVGKCAYSCLILPKMHTMSSSTNKLLQEFVNNGGKIVLYKGKPSYLEGDRYNYPYLKGNCSLKELKEQSRVKIYGGGSFRSTLRRDENGREFLYIVNLGKSTKAKIFLDGKNNLIDFDIMTGRETLIGDTVFFEEGQSKILYANPINAENRTANTAETYVTDDKTKALHFGKTYRLPKEVDNYMLLDFASYSKDGKTYGEKAYCMKIFDTLLKERYDGKLYIKYIVKMKYLPKEISLQFDKNHIEKVWINGRLTNYCQAHEKERNCIEVGQYMQMGENEIVLELHYYQDEKVYRALFGGADSSSLKNCLTYNTTIEEVVLCGKFGVYGDWTKGKISNVFWGENLYIDKQKTAVQSLVKDGFPFFSGQMEFEQVRTIKDTARYIRTPERHHGIEISINGKIAGELIWNNRLNIQNFLRKGKNTFKIWWNISNRNLMGILHSTEEEPFLTTVDGYEMFFVWGKPNEAQLFTEKYACMETLK